MATLLATYAYDALGRRSSVTFGNGSVRSYGYDAASQLTQLTNNLPGTANDLTLDFTYNAAGQIASNTRSNDAYAWTGHFNVDRLTSVDGLNRILNQSTGGSPTAFTYDGRGNLTANGTSTYTYNIDNMLLSGPNAAGFKYDPLGRLRRSGGNGVPDTQYQYDAISLIAEYDALGALQRRYVHGPGTDEPIVWYEGSAVSNATRRFLMADERGSITSVSDSTGTLLGINTYDEYGIPASTNMGRFGYTGQTWLPEISMWHYRARIYAPQLGRFLQTDPIGYGDGMNLYAYVGGDPVNYIDPLGLQETPPEPGPTPDDIVVTGRRIREEVASYCEDNPASVLCMGLGNIELELSCDPSTDDRFANPITAVVAAARQDRLRAGDTGEATTSTRRDADGRFRNTSSEPGPTRGTADLRFFYDGWGISHAHPPGGGSRLSTSVDNGTGRPNDVDSIRSGLRQMQEYFNNNGVDRNVRDTFVIALAGDDGNTYIWLPGDSLNSDGRNIGQTLCQRR